MTNAEPAPGDASDEIASLIATLERTGQRLEELTGGEVDAVADGAGRTFFLRHTQEGLRDQEARRQAAILNALPAHIVLLDANGVIVSANEAWRKFATDNNFQGPGFAVGVNYLGLCDQARGENSAGGQSAAEGIRSVLAGASHFSLEYPCHSPTEQRWFLMTVAPLADTGAGVVVMHQNITERRLTEASFEALSRKTESRERMLTTTLSSLTDFAYIYDRAGRFQFANQPLLDLWGRSLEEVVGKDFFDLDYPPDLAQRLQNQIQEVIETGHSVKGETPYTSPTGVEGSYEYIFSPAFGPDGNVEFVVGSTRDISERKRTEAALRESNLKFEQLADHITDAFWVRSADFSEVQYVSPAFERIWGRSVASLRENPHQWSEFILPEDRERVVAAFAGLTDSTPTLEIEYRIVRPDGDLRWIRVRGSQVRNADGELIRHVGIVTDITAQVQVAAQLRASLAEFRQLAESMPQIVWITTADGQNIYFSRQWMEYTGLTLDESLGDGWNTPFHPEDRKAAWGAWQQATTTVGIYAVESRLRRADGVYRWWLMRGVPHVDESGRITKWFGTCTDIHDLKIAELEVARVNRGLTMLSGTNEALFREHQETALLNAVCRIAIEDGSYATAWIGYAPDHDDDVIIPVAHAGAGDVDGLLDSGAAAQVLRTGKAVTCEDLSRHPESSPSFVAAQRGYRGCVFLPLHDGASTFGVLGLFSHDTLETSAQELVLLQKMADNLAFGIRHQRAEVERARLDGRVRQQAALLDIVREAIMVKDLDGRILYWNKGAERIYGWSAQEALGRSVDDLLRTERTASDIDRKVIVHQKEWQGEQIRHTKDGRRITVEAGWTVVRDEHGQPRSILAVNADVTERLKLEAQFHQAQKMEAVGRLAGGVAHDFNNLLTAILGYCELLLDGLDQSDPRQADLVQIQKAGTSAAGLTRQLLAFSRNQMIEPSLLDLNDVVGEFRELIGRVIGEDVKVVVALASRPALLQADRGQIEQVVMNLAVNARDAMPNGGTLTIETSFVDLDEHYAKTHVGVTPGQYVVLRVTDTGTGMTPDVQARLFEPFFTTKELGKGTGLGLATVYGIVTRSGGSVGVYSEVGKGTAFNVYFPQVDAGELAAEVPVPVNQRRTGSRTVLVVEDEKALRLLAKRLLQRLGYTVLLAADAAEARRLFEQHPEIDLLLTDVIMPGTSGPDLMRELRELRPALKVLFMSGYTEDAIVHHGVLTSRTALLHKPFTSQTLGQKIRDVLER